MSPRRRRAIFSCNSSMGRRTLKENTTSTAAQITKAPPAATAITLLRGPGSSDEETSTNSSSPLTSTTAIGSSAFSAQFMCRARSTTGAAATARPDDSSMEVSAVLISESEGTIVSKILQGWSGSWSLGA